MEKVINSNGFKVKRTNGKKLVKGNKTHYLKQPLDDINFFETDERIRQYDYINTRMILSHKSLASFCLNFFFSANLFSLIYNE